MKVLCPYHDDTTPSCHIYSDNFFCFVCGAYGKTEKLGLKELAPTLDTIVKPDNVQANIEYIESLPCKEIRGLYLPYDSQGYFIVWPDKSYYKLRLWEGKSRYRAPKGIKKPLFKYPTMSSTLVVVEGELNLMSLAAVIESDESLCSPGPCTDMLRYIKYYLSYENIIIIADRDAAGAVYGKELRDQLVSLKKRASLYVIEKDFNDVLQQKGEEAVQEEFERAKHLAV